MPTVTTVVFTDKKVEGRATLRRVTSRRSFVGLPVFFCWRAGNFTQLFLLHPVGVERLEVGGIVCFLSDRLCFVLLEIVQRTVQTLRRGHGRGTREVLCWP